ncbi:MAG: hypothetical protein QNJ68_07620 [Microcoleaceae cyanobacterium MO_207.B10]|nr:hypothetical protein [Microcoleaceae cyanobacterium MO_207.B10]
MKNYSFGKSFNTKFSFPYTFLIDSIIFVVIVSLIISVTSIYVSNEHTIYWWDFVGYENAAHNLANLFRESPQKAVNDIFGSLSQQKNYLVTLPLIPFIYFFGNERLIYILSLNLIYLLPFCLLVSKIATKLILVNSRWVFWSTTIITLLIPIIWAPSLRGYPDIGASLFILLAIAIYLKNIKLTSWWQIPTMGLFLGISIILRRHFAYTAIALLGAMSCQAIINFFTTVKPLKKSFKQLLETAIKIALISIAAFLTISIVAWGFIQSSFTEDYRTLYAAWSLSIPDIFWRYVCFYGLGTWLFVALGFSTGILTKTLVYSTSLFLFLFGIFSVIEWLIILRYGNIHYSLHFTPIIILGLTSFFWTTINILKGKTRLIILTLASTYLLVNLVFGLTDLGKFNHSLRPLFSTNFSPLVRSDYNQVLLLADYLSKLAPNQELVYIAAASNQFNANIIRNANRIINPQSWWQLNAISKPHIDTRDTYPLTELLEAKYVVVAHPFQKVLLTDEQVLKPGQQDLVKFVYDAFTENLPIAQDFQKLPTEFVLDRGINVSLYQRIRGTSITKAVQTLLVMQEKVPQRPGRQLDWMSLNQSPYITYNYSAVTQHKNDSYKLMTDPSDRTKQTSRYFLYLGKLSSPANIVGKFNFLNQECAGLSLRLSMLDLQGNVTDTTLTKYIPGGSSDLNFNLEGKNFAYLLLEVVGIYNDQLADNCGWEIHNLKVN